MTTPECAARPPSRCNSGIIRHHSMALPGVFTITQHQSMNLRGGVADDAGKRRLAAFQISFAIIHHPSVDLSGISFIQDQSMELPVGTADDARMPIKCHPDIIHQRSMDLPFGAADDARVRRSTAFHILSYHQIPPISRSFPCRLLLHSAIQWIVREWRMMTPECAARPNSSCSPSIMHHHFLDFPDVHGYHTPSLNKIQEGRLTTPECAAWPPSIFSPPIKYRHQQIFQLAPAIRNRHSMECPGVAADDARVRGSTDFHNLSCHQIPPLSRSFSCLLPLRIATQWIVRECD